MIKVSILRASILLSLFTIGMLGVFAIPVDDSTTWYFDLLFSKLIGGACLWIFSKLYEHWKKTDKWIKAYDKWNDPEAKSKS